MESTTAHDESTSTVEQSSERSVEQASDWPLDDEQESQRTALDDTVARTSAEDTTTSGSGSTTSTTADFTGVSILIPSAAALAVFNTMLERHEKGALAAKNTVEAMGGDSHSLDYVLACLHSFRRQAALQGDLFAPRGDDAAAGTPVGDAIVAEQSSQNGATGTTGSENGTSADAGERVDPLGITAPAKRGPGRPKGSAAKTPTPKEQKRPKTSRPAGTKPNTGRRGKGR